MKTIDDAYKKIDKINKEIKNADCIYWAISTQENPHELIGTICLFHFKKQHYRGEVGYLLHPDFSKQNKSLKISKVCVPGKCYCIQF